MEPMNTTPHHPKLKVTLGLGGQLFVAGAEITGRMEVEAKTDKGLGVSVMMVELLAVQGPCATLEHVPRQLTRISL